jgi:hypothetical protein
LLLDLYFEFIYLKKKQIKVKCRRLSTESESTKNKESIGGNGMKLTIKATLSGCRKPNNNRELSTIINKKKTGGIISSVKQQRK